ncbi:Smr/MutS family protein [Beijerinckia sp. L45]|uniref:Smr/MutS family protein n=1 Tax=Beijerinckia sp. L45 TaxID=1641855 RepID=UPI001FED931E|nr:Smr/MutS family protein [Beijerinckia sp. L45]
MTKKADVAKGPPPPSSRKLRRLSDDEIDLWLLVAEKVVRRPGSAVPERIRIPPSPKPEATPVTASAPVAIKQPLLPKQPPLAPLERKLKQRLSRGRMTADAAIDLHGFRQTEAYHALHHFLLRSQRRGMTVVIVVTGKGGKPGTFLDVGGGEIGVLRRAVPLWLNMPDFRPMVLGFEEAARHHGGSGALYVRLRRRDRA